jgi:hypothetical protein
MGPSESNIACCMTSTPIVWPSNTFQRVPVIHSSDIYCEIILGSRSETHQACILVDRGWQ